MKYEDYNPETICREMGMSGFIDESWKQRDLPTLRLLFTPSFSPEMCLTVTRQPDGVAVSVTTFVRQLWVTLFERPFAASTGQWPCFSDHATLIESSFDELTRLFAEAKRESEKEYKGICLDGIGLEACLVSREKVERFHFHFGTNPIIEEFGDRTVKAVWTACRDPHVRNALAHLLGRDWPLDEIPEPEPVTMLGVFGSAEERNEYFEKLRRRNAGSGSENRQ